MTAPANVSAPLHLRVMAKAIDLAIVLTIAAVVPYPLGPLMALAYSLCADGMHFKNFRSQSVGKRLMGLRVVSVIGDFPIDMRTSFYRNIPIGVMTLFALIPLWGWIVLILVGIPIVMMELYLMKRKAHGQRLGDVLGDTRVVLAREETA